MTCLVQKLLNLKPKLQTESLFSQSGYFNSNIGKVSRRCDHSSRVRVYRNLNKPEFFSILAMDGENKGKVVGYAKAVIVEQPKYIVSLKSRERVLRDNRRNVHGFIEGKIIDAYNSILEAPIASTLVTYQPFVHSCFTEVKNGSPWTQTTNFSLIQQSGAYAYN